METKQNLKGVLDKPTIFQTKEVKILSDKRIEYTLVVKNESYTIPTIIDKDGNLCIIPLNDTEAAKNGAYAILAKKDEIIKESKREYTIIQPYDSKSKVDTFGNYLARSTANWLFTLYIYFTDKSFTDQLSVFEAQFMGHMKQLEAIDVKLEPNQKGYNELKALKDKCRQLLLWNKGQNFTFFTEKTLGSDILLNLPRLELYREIFKIYGERMITDYDIEVIEKALTTLKPNWRKEYKQLMVNFEEDVATAEEKIKEKQNGKTNSN